MGFTLFVILFVLIGSVSATDDNTATLSQSTDNEISQEKISTVNDDSILEGIENNGILKIDPENTTLKTSVSGDTFTDIQTAISSASSGDTIELDGLYKGSGTAIIIDKNNLTIVGNDAILDAQGQSRILNITGTGVTLKNIKFINGNAADNGGAIYWYGNNGTINDCNFTNNKASNGGAIYWYGGNGTIIKSDFTNNTAESDGGAIYWQGPDGNISNCEINSTFINNGATRGGAIFFNKETDNIIIAGYFEGNVAKRTGGALCFQAQSSNNIISADFYNNSAIYASGGAIFFRNLAENNQFECNFRYNRAAYGAGIFFYNKANNNNFSGDFRFNVAESCGGAIFFYNTTNNNKFTGYFINNSALGKISVEVGNGGAITFKDTSCNSIFNCDFVNNTAALCGGAVNYRQTPHNITFNGNFINNTAKYGGGACFLDSIEDVVYNGEFIGNNAIQGGAVYIGNSVSDCMIDSVFIDNYARQGGAIFFNNETDNVTIKGYFEGNEADRIGGALCFQSKACNNVISAEFYENRANAASGGAIFFRNIAENNQFAGIFKNNYAINGGAIFFYNKTNNNTFDCDFSFNVANSSGGAIVFFDTADNNDFTGCFTNNSALGGSTGDRSGNGGAITFSAISSNCTFTCDFINNTAAFCGGAVNYRQTPHNITFNGNFINNTAYYGGGVSFLDNLENVVFNGKFIGNSAKYGGAGYSEIKSSDVVTPYNGGKFLVATLIDGNGATIQGVGISVKLNEIVNNLTTNSAGQISLSCDKLYPGEYVAEIVFKGDGNLKGCEKSVTVTVEKLTPNIVVDVDDIEVGQVAHINVTLSSEATGKVALIFDNQNYTKDAENGKALFEISDLPVGNHTFDVAYAGDNVYKNSSMIKSIEVKKINISYVELPTFIPEDGKFAFELPSAAKGTVTLKINEKEYSSEVKDGEVVIDVSELPKGEYEYTVTYSGDENFEAFTKGGVLNIGYVVTSIAFTQVDGNCVVEGVLMDDAGRGIANMNLTAKVNESNITVKTDTNGKFVIQAEDNSALAVAFAGKDWLLATNNTIVLKNITPVRTATNIIAKDYETYSIDFKAGERGNYFKVQLLDADGKALANKAVKIGFNGVVYDRVTDSEGRAQLQINLKNAGVYTFAVAFLGDDDYKGSFVVNKITVNKKTTKISAPAKTFKASAKTKSYTVTLSTIKGSSIDGKTYLEAGKQIKLTINGKTYTATTNSKGQATFKLSITKKGKFTASIKFEGDKAYDASSKSAIITIN